MFCLLLCYEQFLHEELDIVSEFELIVQVALANHGTNQPNKIQLEHSDRKIQTVGDALQLRQYLINPSCPWNMPQLASNSQQRLLFSFLAYFFLLSAQIQLQQYYTLDTWSLPLGPFWSQSTASWFLGTEREIWGKGLYIAPLWQAILLNRAWHRNDFL